MPVDLSATPWLRGVMATHKSLPIRPDYTKIGMIMEDAALIALKLGGTKGELDAAKALELEEAVVKIVALMGATHSIPE